MKDINVSVAQIKSFEITGLLYNSKIRFKKSCNSYHQAMMINLWRGSVWALMENNKRKLLKRVYN